MDPESEGTQAADEQATGEYGEQHPPRCLSFTVRGPWGHFRRIEGNVVRQTYRMIPRTTVAGLIGAIIGAPRDSYYGAFQPNNSAIAIEPIQPPRTINLPEISLSTAGEHLDTFPTRGPLKVTLPDTTADRQRVNYETLVDPAYRIDVWLDDEDTYSALKTHLEEGTSQYAPSLGLSEHLAEISYHGEFEVVRPNKTSGPFSVDSTVVGVTDNILISRDESHNIERSPAFMEADDGGRTTTGFATLGYQPDANQLKISGGPVTHVADRTVIFS